MFNHQFPGQFSRGVSCANFHREGWSGFCFMNEITETSLNIEVIAAKERLTIFPNVGGGISIAQAGIDGEVIIAIELNDLKPLIAGLRLLQKELKK